MDAFIRKIVGEACAFALLLAVYCTPLVLGLSHLGTDDFRVQQLFEQALSVPAVRFEIARNVTAHVGLLTLLHVTIALLAGRFAVVTGIRLAICRIGFLIVVWLLLAAVNRQLFPLSDYLYAVDTLAKPPFAIALLLVLIAACSFMLWRSNLRVWRASMVVGGAVAIVTLVTGVVAPERHVPPVQNARNVIIVGIDSLSGPTFESARSVLPNLSALLERGVYFEQAHTPLGRTFPAWMSLLSGDLPAEHGAIFNLRSIDHVARGDLLTDALKGLGYRTVFALDERRFSNIDESFGFDRVVGPAAGVLDFLLQGFNDMPLSNLILQTSIGGAMLPFSYLNAASHANYDAAAFVQETVAAASGAERLFLAVHLESAHFPFKSRHSVSKVGGANLFRARHVSALTGVDVQVGQLMSALAERGYLDDALVIVLSDHGEGFGEIEAQTTRDGRPFNLVGYGHGANVLSENQSRIVLGLIRFVQGRPVGEPLRRTDLVSLTDVRSAVEGFAATGQIELAPTGRCLISETGLRFLSAANYETLNAADLAAEGAGYYEIDQAGRMKLRESALASLVASKDVALRCRDRITFFSAADARYRAYAMNSATGMDEVAPEDDDIARIEAYRKLLLSSVAPR